MQYFAWTLWVALFQPVFSWVAAPSAVAMIPLHHPFRVVIDPGHGGGDEGTVYDNGRVVVSEKDVTLALAHEAARQLRKKNFEVTLTRQMDRDLSLSARTELANRLKADVFLSIHMNSSPSAASPGGIETFILNNTTDASSRRLAHLENSVLAGGTNHPQDRSGEEQDIALILKDLRLDANLSKSKQLACQVQNQIVLATTEKSIGKNAYHSSTNTSNRLTKHNRGVKQALFYVLLGADMPSILVEAGFLTNSHDRNLVLSPEGRTRIGQAIARGVEAFKQQHSTSVKRLSNCKIN